MKNTVIANRKKGDWEIIKKYFEDRGVKIDPIAFEGQCFPKTGNVFYYGIIKGKFENYTLYEAQQANATILEVSDIDKEFKVGDVVVVTQNSNEAGEIGKIINYSGYYFVVEGLVHRYSKNQLRHATPEERAIYYAQIEIDKALNAVSDTVTLPKSLVLQAHKEACSDWKKRIEEVVPELFVKKMEFEKGKWYKGDDVLFCYDGTPNGTSSIGGYGFRLSSNIYAEENRFFCDLSKLEPATEQEVFEALKNEAVNRGFKEGARVESTYDGNKYPLNNSAFRLDRDGYNTLAFGGVQIFKNGNWATIIKPQIPQELESLISKLGKDKILEYLKD